MRSLNVNAREDKDTQKRKKKEKSWFMSIGDENGILGLAPFNLATDSSKIGEKYLDFMSNFKGNSSGQS